MVVHGIPGSYALQEGHILSADIGVTRYGFFATAPDTLHAAERSPVDLTQLGARRPALREPRRAGRSS